MCKLITYFHFFMKILASLYMFFQIKIKPFLLSSPKITTLNWSKTSFCLITPLRLSVTYFLYANTLEETRKIFHVFQHVDLNNYWNRFIPGQASGMRGYPTLQPGFSQSSHSFLVFAMLETVKVIWHTGRSPITQTSCRGLHLDPVLGDRLQQYTMTPPGVASVLLSQ